MTALYILGLLILVAGFVFVWTCLTSIEAFSNMRPWFGYEPGLYGPGWGRNGCSTDKACMKD
jgi:hypothetical protein